MIRWHKHVLFLLAQLVLDDSDSDSDSGDSNSDSGDSGNSSDSAASSSEVSDSGDAAANSNSNNSLPRSSREASQTSSPSSVGAGVQDIANLQNVTDTQLGNIPPRDVGIGPLDQPQLPLDGINPPDFTEGDWPNPDKKV